MTQASSIHYRQFLERFPLQSYPKGSILISPSENLPDIIFLEKGCVSKYTITKFGEKAVMNIFTTQVPLPLSWVLNKTLNRYYFEAQSPVEVRWIPADELTAYLKTNPEITYDLLRKVYLGLEITQRRITYLMRGSIKTRLLFELFIEADRAGKVRDDGSIVISITETELGDRAGVSRESISREFAKIFNIGNICKREGRSIVIPNLQELDEMIHKTV